MVTRYASLLEFLLQPILAEDLKISFMFPIGSISIDVNVTCLPSEDKQPSVVIRPTP